MARKQLPPRPLDLLFMLADTCMAKLSPIAWKVVSYIAVEHLRAHPELLLSVSDPLRYHFNRDAEALGVLIDSSANLPPGSDRPYRTVGGAAPVPGETAARLAVISLAEICKGVQVKGKSLKRGTGLSKSSVAKAVNEAVNSGIVLRQPRQSTKGRDLSSLYGIDWDMVQYRDWERRKGLDRPPRQRRNEGLKRPDSA